MSGLSPRHKISDKLNINNIPFSAHNLIFERKTILFNFKINLIFFKSFFILRKSFKDKKTNIFRIEIILKKMIFQEIVLPVKNIFVLALWRNITEIKSNCVVCLTS